MRRAVKVLIISAIVLFFFAAPIVPTPNGEIIHIQLAGFFPHYESLSCALLHVGVAYGPDSFQNDRWTPWLACSICWPSNHPQCNRW